jgi:hypothetical protein
MFYDIDDNLILKKKEYTSIRLKNNNEDDKSNSKLNDISIFIPNINIKDLDVILKKFKTSESTDKEYIEDFTLTLLDGYQEEIKTYNIKLDDKENKVLLENVNFKQNEIYIIKIEFDFSNIEGFIFGEWLYNITFNVPERKDVSKGDNMGADEFLEHVSEILKEDGVSFSKALKACKSGKRIQRKGWNGKGMFVYYVGEDSYPAKTKAAKNTFKDNVPYLPYLALKTVDEKVVPWTISQTDALAEDWVIL